MKLESLVIVDQHATVNTFSGLVHTACHVMGVGSARMLYVCTVEGKIDDCNEVITR